MEVVYRVEYEQTEDNSVDLIQNLSLVRDINSRKIYRYIGENADLELSLQDFSDSSKWEFTGQTSNVKSYNDPPLNRYDSDYRNISTKEKTWTSGGGFLQKKTYHYKLTIIQGLKDYYTHALKADYPIDIQFLQGPSSSEANISIKSVGGLELYGDIESPSSNLQLRGAYIQGVGSSVIYANTKESGEVGSLDALSLKADSGSIDVAMQGGLQPLNAIAQRNINLLIVSPDNQSSYLVFNHITAGGDVSIRAADGITGYDNNAVITGDDIILNSSKGGIGTAQQWVNVNTNDSGGVGGNSLNDVYIRQTTGDLYLLGMTSAADVYLDAIDGSILDNLGEQSSLATRVISDKALATFAEDSLRYPLSVPLYSFLYPLNKPTGFNTPPDTGEDYNIVARNLTVTTGRNLGKVGRW
ncbi:hypothetical protein [Anabaenopsis elenkinii]|uniref:Uncharacterized protein n=1 Tax=Anabaenopsis elenkinii CCIBt3563 TaxID=2779889 RepID=A0A7S6U6P8_9CYAN|nr:hypothetical protein [Anabaenopsis elenkinii]QOV24149.1 hypothetical protein IM676_07845 [Anabaenopsis elenkinii CCIBt3563]